LTDRKDPLFSETVEESFDAVRRHILEMEEEAEAERPAISSATLAAARAFCRSASPNSSS
jgi:hypothetical protein